MLQEDVIKIEALRKVNDLQVISVMEGSSLFLTQRDCCDRKVTCHGHYGFNIRTLGTML